MGTGRRWPCDRRCRPASRCRWWPTTRTRPAGIASTGCQPLPNTLAVFEQRRRPAEARCARAAPRRSTPKMCRAARSDCGKQRLQTTTAACQARRELRQRRRPRSSQCRRPWEAPLLEFARAAGRDDAPANAHRVRPARPRAPRRAMARLESVHLFSGSIRPSRKHSKGLTPRAPIRPTRERRQYDQPRQEELDV